jgi:signal peptide peptidase SppA
MLDRTLAMMPEAIPLSLGASLAWLLPKSGPTVDIDRDGTAWVGIRGPLQFGQSLFNFGDSVDLDALAIALNKLRMDPKVYRVMVMIDSPGGTVSGTAAAGDAMKALAVAKPTVAYVENLCVSGAYWLASQASKIVASRTSLIGSIGVYTVARDYSELLTKSGIKSHLISSGRFKGKGALGTPVDEDTISDAQRIIDQLALEFFDTVQQARQLADNVMSVVTDGRVWIAEDAKFFNLIDAVGGLSVAINMLNKIPLKLNDDQLLVKDFRQKSNVEIWSHFEALSKRFPKAYLEANYPEFSQFALPCKPETPRPQTWRR